MIYRREIDGLRAVAVLPVVFFHAGFNVFRGGYVGVDVFLVISGYLITSLISQELSTGQFSLASFYERRARRILPALLFVLLSCIPFAYLWMAPNDLEAFAGSLISVVLFVSNFFFYGQSGYFDQAVELKPLIHTWSLSVEEQFYILFPITLLILFRYVGSYLRLSLAMLLFGSFALAQMGGYLTSNPYNIAASWWDKPLDWGFYLLPTRAWELLIGSLIALYQHQPIFLSLSRNQAVRQTGSLFGLVLILFAATAFDSSTPVPGVYTLIPVLGAALLLMFAYEGTTAYWLLTRPILVGLGLISYSFYLWHQPLFAFARIRSIDEPSGQLFTLLILSALFLAYLSWRFIEKPSRNKSFLSASPLIGCTASVAVVLILAGSAGCLTRGFPSRMPYKVEQAAIEQTCNLSASNKLCAYGVGNPSVAVIGDSHAGALIPALAEEFRNMKKSVLDFHLAGCLPVKGFVRKDIAQCSQQADIIQKVLKEDSIDTVIVASRWALWFERTRFDNREGGKELGPTLELSPDDGTAFEKIKLGQAILETVNALLDRGKIVVLVYPVPEVGWRVPSYMFKLARLNLLNEDVSTSYSVFKSRANSAESNLDRVEARSNLIRVYPERALCNTRKVGRCLASLDKVALYKDEHHLNDVGARLVARQIIAELSSVQTARAAALIR